MRYLVTTADEATWKHGEPILFLGNWCCRYDRKKQWEKLDYRIASPYGITAEEKDLDRLDSSALQKEIFPLLCQILNNYLSCNHSERYWMIILGPWFWRYVDAILNRVNTFTHCLETNLVDGMTVYEIGSYTLATDNTQSSVFAFNDDRWNLELFYEIYRLLNIQIAKLTIIKGNDAVNFKWKFNTKKRSAIRRLLSSALNIFSFFASKFSKDFDAVIINSYLPKIEEALLQIALGQFPQRWGATKIGELPKTDTILRDKLANQMVINGEESRVGYVAKKLLFKVIPICFLEGFADVKKIADSQPFPKSPKFIWTSNCYEFDETFKLWAAQKVENGSLYFIGQHGCDYGTHRHWLNPSLESLTADKFLTWGWAGGEREIRAFNFKVANKMQRRYDPKGGLALIGAMAFPRICTWDESYEHKQYLEDQFTFLDSLSDELKLNLTVRLYPTNFYTMPWEKLHWERSGYGVKIDEGAEPISKLISMSRIIVSSYDSTTLLEMLALNIPVLGFWRNGLERIRDDARPYYQDLVDAGIIFTCPKSIAIKLTEIWIDIESWWNSADVQNARIKFSDQYSRYETNPIRALKKILKE